MKNGLGKYGSIQFQGKEQDIDKMSVENIELAMSELEDEQDKLINLQNELLTELLK